MLRYVFTTGTCLAFHGRKKANKRLPYHRKRYNPKPFLRMQRYDDYRLQSVCKEGEWEARVGSACSAEDTVRRREEAHSRMLRELKFETKHFV